MAMKATTIKGALLEYLVRNLLRKCGFINVKADDLYTFERGGLFFVNGKGAAHDADILMEPPIQMPFTYPTRLIFECKAYGKSASLTLVRNALGLRNDINDFEVVTKESIKKRKNNRRASYAIETRRRFVFQVGVAAINDFTRPAIEFAANNKIPLLSLEWFVDRHTMTQFNAINQAYIDSLPVDQLNNLYTFFKDREGYLYDPKYSHASSLLNSPGILGDVVTYSNGTMNYFYVGLIETGDLLFLFKRTQFDILDSENNGTVGNLRAEIHFATDRPNIWKLTVRSNNVPEQSDYDFFVPEKIYNHWREFNLDKRQALDIKQEYFSKIFVFNGRNAQQPFKLINLNMEWLQAIRDLNQ